MNAKQFGSLTSKRGDGTFEYDEENSRVIGFFEGSLSFDSRRSNFIDSPHADLRREEMEEILEVLLVGTCFERNEDEDRIEDGKVLLAFDAEIDDVRLVESVNKVVGIKR